MWGLAYALLLWLVGPAGLLAQFGEGAAQMGMLDTARAHFRDLVAYLIFLGVPLGVTLGLCGQFLKSDAKTNLAGDSAYKI